MSDDQAPENPGLRAAMEAVAASRDEATMRELFKQLIDSRLLVPVNDSTEDGVELPYVEDAEGRKTYHAFTDERAVVALLPQGTPYVAMAASSLAGVVLDDPNGSLVVNPSSPDAGRLSRHDLELVRDKLLPDSDGAVTTAPGGALRILELSEPPPERLVEALTPAAERIEVVLELHLFEAAWGPGQAPHLFLGVRLAPERDPDTRRRALAQLSEAAHPHLGAKQVMDVMELSDELYESASKVSRLIWPEDR